MRVQAVKAFATQGGKVNVGDVLTVPESLLPKLVGLVKVVAPPLTRYEQQLVAESAARADFCEIHRGMLGGTCQHFDVIERRVQGNKVRALNSCLLWQVVRAGRRLDKISTVEVIPGITIGEVLAWSEDVPMITQEHRLLLTAAGGLQADKATHP